MAIRKLKPTLDRSSFHYPEPDFGRTPYHLPEEMRKRMTEKLKFLYGEARAHACMKELERIMKVYYAFKTPEMIEWESTIQPSERFTERDVILITYPDQIVGDKPEPPLQMLLDVATRHLKGVFNTIHILPSYPYSSDRGFAVIDYEQVEPKFGTWDDIKNIKREFHLMFDAVINHVSSKSRWFQEFLYQNPDYVGYFTSYDTKDTIPAEELNRIVRPRTSPVLTAFNTVYGTKYVWTTFSPDQIDLNYTNPKVLQRMVEILLYYVRRGADLLRLDAVTYLWCELGTVCAHIAQTHTIIKLLRDVMDAVAPQVALVTETNAPHEYNTSYFGNGHDEAQMIYNFALPPLVLRAFQTQNAAILTKWAMGLKKISDTTTYLNFLDSHDGIGVMGAQGILSSEEIDEMAQRTLELGGYVSYKDNGDGTVSPYELNITWESALNPDGELQNQELNIRRYLSSRSIQLVLAGVPGIYIHGLLGSKNDPYAVIRENQKRSISRARIEKRFFEDVTEKDITTAYRFIEMIRKRVNEKAFHPNAPQSVFDAGRCFFSVLRTSIDGSEHIIAISNVTCEKQIFSYNIASLGIYREYWYDLFSGLFVEADRDGNIVIELEPYEVLWLKSL